MPIHPAILSPMLKAYISLKSPLTQKSISRFPAPPNSRSPTWKVTVILSSLCSTSWKHSLECAPICMLCARDVVRRPVRALRIRGERMLGGGGEERGRSRYRRRFVKHSRLSKQSWLLRAFFRKMVDTFRMVGLTSVYRILSRRVRTKSFVYYETHKALQISLNLIL